MINVDPMLKAESVAEPETSSITFTTPIPDPVVFSRAELLRWRQKLASLIITAEYIKNVLDIVLWDES